jgi:hypothetical protein
MATLVSPGVSISVTDESFYAPAGTGTVPLIVIATAQNKSSPDGSGTAAYTTAATADTVQLITSQRDLLTNYGNPIFKTSGGTPLHGHELNEYGLMAAYSFLGIANRAYVLRADVDLAALTASAVAPTPAPANGAYWVDTVNSVFGLKRWSGTAWVRQTVKVPTAADMAAGDSPKAGYGINGDFAAAYFSDDGSTLSDIKLYQKISGAWYHIGSSSWQSASGRDFYEAFHTTLPSMGLTAGDLLLQKNSPNNGSDLSIKIYNSLTGQFVTESYVAYTTSQSAYNEIGTAVEGDLWAEFKDSVATVVLKRHNGKSSLVAQSDSALTDTEVSLTGHSNTAIAFNIIVNDPLSTNAYVKVYLTTDSDTDGNASVDDIVADINEAIANTLSFNPSLNTVIASNVSGKVTITDTAGKNILLTAGNVAGFTPANLNLTADVPYSNWEDLSYEASATAITGDLADGTLWYDNVISADNIDILYNNGGGWATYPGDVQVSATAPTKQSDGTSLAAGDLWIDSSDLENYPVIRKYSGSAWVLVDNTDQVSGAGIVFADARVSKTAAVDTNEAGINPNLYPGDILLWNKRASGGNVKRWTVNHTVDGVLIGDRWVDASGNKNDGSPYMLRKAQRRMVVTALQAALASNEDIRNEINRFNLIAAPGYPELLDDMITLNIDRKETAFILVDPPLRLAPSGSALQAWINNSNNADENGEDGLISTSPYVGVYYPHGLTTNLDGTSVLQPASHIALRTLAFNDQVAFPWFAPAGFQRGLVTNATNVGYLDGTTAEFRPVALSEGQRDTLYVNKINPISNFPGRGLAVFGQKTLNPVSSALDRVNVARLVVYIRERLDDIVKPFLFEPNDEVTRQNAKVVVDRFLGQLVTQRGLFDFLTVCDTTNNTPARIDRNELHIDIAIQPVKAVEFIYIPIRIQNTLGQA